MLGIGAVSAQNVILDVTPSSSNMATTNQYNKSFNLTVSDTQIFTVTGFSNNNNGWTTNPMRGGTSTAGNVLKDGISIASKFPFTETISKIEVDVWRRYAAGTKNIITSARVEVSNASDFSNATSYDIDFSEFGTTANATATISATISAPVSGKYYRIVFVLPQAANNGWFGVNAFRFYGETVAGAVDAPAITCADNMVIITADAGCEIYYTTDGTEPNTSSAKYNSPFSITAKTTVKAIAVKDGKTSPTTTKECDYIGNYDGFTSFAAAGAGTQGTVDGPITAYYQNGQNLYVYDSKNKGMLLFGTTETYTNGDVFESVTGTYTEYGTGKVPEITNYTLGAKSTGSAVSPEDGPSLDEISSNEDWRYKYVKIYDVNITSLSGSNFTIVDSSDETLTLPGYNKFKITVSEGEGFTIEGIVDIFNGNPQIYPISISGGTVYDVVETPVFTPESGATLNIGDEITIACATEGASIHYTTDGSEPTATSEPYTGAAILFTGGTFTVKAIAVKDGMADSDVATATYTEYVEGEETAMFDFTKLGTVDEGTGINGIISTPIETAPESGKGKDLDMATTFVNGPIKISFDKETEGTAISSTIPRWWHYVKSDGSIDTYELRVYNGYSLIVESTINDIIIKSITCKISDGGGNLNGLSAIPYTSDVAGTATTLTKTNNTWETSANDVTKVKLLNPATKNGRNDYATISVTYDTKPGSTAIDGIESDDENAPVEYFNLQGIRVNGDNLGTGIYIRRQGSKTTKVLIQR